MALYVYFRDSKHGDLIKRYLYIYIFVFFLKRQFKAEDWVPL